jgi:O-antigen ligase
VTADTPTSKDARIVTLFCAWFLSQCFFYKALPLLKWNVLTPDRLVLLLLLWAIVTRPRPKSAAPARPTRPGQGVAWCAALFTVVGFTSYWLAGADADNTTFAELTRLSCTSVVPFLAFLMARRVQYTTEMLRTVLRFFAALGVYLSITAIAEHYQIGALVFPKYILDPSLGIHFGRSRGPLLDTIGNGGLLLVAYVATCCIAGASTGVRRHVTLFCGLLILPAVYFTETRSVWLGLGATTLTMIVLATPMRRAGVGAFAIILVAFVIGAGSKFSITGNTLFSRRQNTIEGRLDNYDMAWKAFKAHPYFGLGYGRFNKDWSDYFDRQTSRLGIGLDDGNHSTFLGLLADLGVVGTLPFAGMVLGGMLVCFIAYRRIPSTKFPFERQFAVVALGAIETFGVLSLTNDMRSQYAVNVIAFWFVGVISSVQATCLAQAAGSSDGSTSRLSSVRPAAVPSLASLRSRVVSP